MVDAGFLSIIPPIVAIVLALVTKEVIFSFLLGVFSGTIIYYSALAGLYSFGVLFSTTVEIMIDKIWSKCGHDPVPLLLRYSRNFITKAGWSQSLW